MKQTGLILGVALFVAVAFSLSSTLIGQQQTGSEIQQNQQIGAQLKNGGQQQNGTDGQLAGGIDQYEHMLIREPVAPSFLPLAADHQDYLNKLLDHWEKTSSQVKRLTCDFQRWDYNPSICNWRDPSDNRLAAYRVAYGTIQYGDPDKADSRSTKIYDFAGTEGDLGQEAKYVENREEEASERWTCDGKAIYEFDFGNKRLYEVEIPAEMRGKALSQSPLPFLFGAKRLDMEDRFWMRIATPKGVENEYWLEVWPKRKEDSVNYHHVEIIIAAEDFLPKSIHIYARDYDAAQNPVSHFFAFTNRKVNDQLTGIKDFFGIFIRPQTPIGWERTPLNRMQGPSGVSADSNLNPRVGAQVPDTGSAAIRDR